MTLTERARLTQQLGEMMSDYSESVWAAGWIMGNEDSCPDAVKRIVEFGSGTDAISWEAACIMVDIAEQLGHWACLGGQNVYIPWIPHVGPWRQENSRG